jgi:hypothetical protein
MILKFIESMLADRKFQVQLNGNVSKYKYLQIAPEMVSLRALSFLQFYSTPILPI